MDGGTGAPVQRPLTVLLAGDSTVAACPAAEVPMSGWGPFLAGPLNARVNANRAAAGIDGEPVVLDVINTAKGGATTASHRSEGLWRALLLLVRPGDVVVVQFGHNDQKDRALAARDGFAANLRRFVHDVRERAAVPVLCTSVARRRFVDGRLVDTHGDHPAAVREVAGELRTPCIDLAAATAGLYTRFGPDGSRDLFTHFPPDVHPLWPDGVADDTHFSALGARLVADLVAERLAGLVTRLFDQSIIRPSTEQELTRS